MTELEKGVQLGIILAAEHCAFHAKKHEDQGRKRQAKTLREEADSLRALALNHKKHKPLISPELK